MEEERYFKNVKDMIDYASGDIENFGNFEFEYGLNGGYKAIHRVEYFDEIEKVDDETFKLRGIYFDLNLVTPCY